MRGESSKAGSGFWLLWVFACTFSCLIGGIVFLDRDWRMIDALAPGFVLAVTQRVVLGRWGVLSAMGWRTPISFSDPWLAQTCLGVLIALAVGTSLAGSLVGAGFGVGVFRPMDGPVMLWNSTTGKPLRILAGHGTKAGMDYGISSAAFSPDGTKILTGSDGLLDSGFTVKLCEARSGRELQTFTGHTDRITSVAFSPDGATILTGSDDETAILWDAMSGSKLHVFHSTLGVHSVAFSPDGVEVLIGGFGTILYDVASKKKVRSFQGGGGGSVAFSPDGSRVLIGALKTATLWDAMTGEQLQTFTVAERGRTAGTSVAFSPDGGKVLAACMREARLYDTASGEEIRTLAGHAGLIYSVAFSPDGTRVLTGSEDTTAKVWDTTSGAELRTLAVRRSRVTSVAFSPDGTKILTGSGFGTPHATSLGDVIGIVPWVWAVIGASLGLVLGYMQWLALRRVVSPAAWWIVANIGGWGGGALVLATLLRLAGDDRGPVLFGSLAASGAITGAITGGVLVWLLRRAGSKVEPNVD